MALPSFVCFEKYKGPWNWFPKSRFSIFHYSLHPGQKLDAEKINLNLTVHVWSFCFRKCIRLHVAFIVILLSDVLTQISHPVYVFVRALITDRYGKRVRELKKSASNKFSVQLNFMLEIHYQHLIQFVYNV